MSPEDLREREVQVRLMLVRAEVELAEAYSTAPTIDLARRISAVLDTVLDIERELAP